MPDEPREDEEAELEDLTPAGDDADEVAGGASRDNIVLK